MDLLLELLLDLLLELLLVLLLLLLLHVFNHVRIGGREAPPHNYVINTCRSSRSSSTSSSSRSRLNHTIQQRLGFIKFLEIFFIS